MGSLREGRLIRIWMLLILAALPVWRSLVVESQQTPLVSFGEAYGDRRVSGDDYAAKGNTSLTPFGVGYSSYYASTNGIVTFDASFSGFNSRLPLCNLGLVLIAPLFTDLVGDAYYRLDTDANRTQFERTWNSTRRVLASDVQQGDPFGVMVVTWNASEYTHSSVKATLQLNVVWFRNASTTLIIFRYQRVDAFVSHQLQVGYCLAAGCCEQFPYTSDVCKYSTPKTTAGGACISGVVVRSVSNPWRCNRNNASLRYRRSCNFTETLAVPITATMTTKARVAKRSASSSAHTSTRSLSLTWTPSPDTSDTQSHATRSSTAGELTHTSTHNSLSSTPATDVRTVSATSSVTSTLPMTNATHGQSMSTSVSRTKVSPSVSSSAKSPPGGSLAVVTLLRSVSSTFARTTAVPLSLAGGAGAGPLQRALLQMQLTVGCSASSLSDPLDVTSSPTVLGFGYSSGRYLRGAVIGNMMVLAAFGGMAVVVVYGRAVWRLKTWRVGMDTVARGAASMGMPGLLFGPWMLLMQPIVSSSTTCVVMSYRGLAGPVDVTVGVVGTVVLVIIGVALVRLLTTETFQATAVLINRSSRNTIESSERRCAWWAPTRCLQLLLLPRYRWKSTSGNGSLFVRSFGFIFEGYRAHRQWFACVEYAASVFAGVLSGLQPLVSSSDNTAPCYPLVLALTTVNVLQLIAAVILRPYNRLVELAVSLLSNAAGVSWGVLMIVGASNHGDVAAAYLTIVQVLLQSIPTLIAVTRILLWVWRWTVGGAVEGERPKNHNPQLKIGSQFRTGRKDKDRTLHELIVYICTSSQPIGDGCRSSSGNTHPHTHTHPVP